MILRSPEREKIVLNIADGKMIIDDNHMVILRFQYENQERCLAITPSAIFEAIRKNQKGRLKTFTKVFRKKRP